MSIRISDGAKVLAGMVIGGLAGAALALVLTPQTGQETRAQIKDTGLKLVDRAGNSVLETRQRAQKQASALLQHQVAAISAKGKESFAQGKHNAAEAVNRGMGWLAKPS